MKKLFKDTITFPNILMWVCAFFGCLLAWPACARQSLNVKMPEALKIIMLLFGMAILIASMIRHFELTHFNDKLSQVEKTFLYIIYIAILVIGAICAMLIYS